MYENLVKTIINDYNGTIKPLIIDSKLTNGTGITNSSLLVEGDKIHMIMRHVEYTLYHCENEQKYQSAEQGPLSYYHREDRQDKRHDRKKYRKQDNDLKYKATSTLDHN